MSRHSPILSERAERTGETVAYRPQRLEVRTRRAPKAPLWAKSCLGVGIVLILLAGVGLTGLKLTSRYDDSVKRADLLPAANATAGDASGPIKGPINILVLGSDGGAGNVLGPGGNHRSDTILLLHIGPGLDRGYAISFPRDALVDIPAYGRWPTAKARLISAYTAGGAPRLVRTIEKLSGLTVDHVVAIDFAGVRTITDAVGGVDIYLDTETPDPAGHGRPFTQGLNHLSGDRAVAYIGQRRGLDGGDSERIRRQQQYLHALLERLSSSGVRTDVGKVDDLLLAVTDVVTVDRSMRVRDLALALHSLSDKHVSFLTLPVLTGQRVDNVWVELPDEAAMAELFGALRKETMDAYLAVNPPNDVSHGG